MADVRERRIGDLTVRIDRETCIGSGNCTKVAPAVFELDDERVAAFKESPEKVETERVVEACRVCPVAALTAIDAGGTQLVP